MCQSRLYYFGLRMLDSRAHRLSRIALSCQTNSRCRYNKRSYAAGSNERLKKSSERNTSLKPEGQEKEIWAETDDEIDELQDIDNVVRRVRTYEPKKKKHEWLLTLMGYNLPGERRHRAAHFIYHKCLQHTMNPQFARIFSLEDSFRIELQMLCLHMWIAKTRCLSMKDPEEGRKLNKAAFNMMFGDFACRYAKHISGFVTKWERDCQQVCFQLALSMDHAQQDFEDDPESFSKVMWQYVYLSDPNMDHEVLYLWSDYITYEIDTLKDISDEEFMKGWWDFSPPPCDAKLSEVRQRLLHDAEISEK